MTPTKQIYCIVL